MKYKIKKNDEVVIISGSHRGKRGKILEVLRDSCRVIVEGIG
jgi:large subunit ribosomal protein L24